MAETKERELPKTHRAVRWHPPSYDVRVEDVPFPKWEIEPGTPSDCDLVVLTPPRRIEHPDDAIVKITVRTVVTDGSP